MCATVASVAISNITGHEIALDFGTAPVESKTRSRYARGVRALVRDDIRSAADTLAHAFHDDPLFSFLVPKPRQRRRWIQLFMTKILFDTIGPGLSFAPDDGPQAGVIGWLLPGGYPAPGGYWSFLWSRRRERPGLTFPTMRLLTAGVRGLRWIEQVHPLEPHYYLVVIGVHPDRKGRGLGGQLLRPGLADADRDQLPAYLETSNEANLGLYRRFGFDVVDELDPGRGAPPVWTMRREPR